MAAAELEVIIGANTKGIEDGANRAEKALTNIGKSIQKLEKDISANIVISKGYGNAIEDLTTAYNAGDISQKKYSQGIKRLQRDEKETQVETKRLTAELRNLQREQKQLSTGLNTGAGAMNKFGKSTSANAVPAMTSFSQVIQDAPYGIQGVANNIQQLTMQMGYLSKSAGGTKAALSSMLGTLAGPTGILLAVSLVTTLLVKYGDQLMELVGSTNKLTDATKEYIGEAMAEASELKVLVDIANNHNASIVARRKAIEEINSKYGEYLGNIDEESIKTDKVKTSINNLTKALIQQAQIKGLKDVIGEETAKNAEDLTAAQFAQIRAWDDIKNQLSILKDHPYWGKVFREGQNNLEQVNAIIKASKGLNEEGLNGFWGGVSALKEANNQMSEIEKSTAKTLEPFQKLQQALMERVFGITVVPEFDQEEIVIKGKNPKVNVDLQVNPHNPDMLDLENDTLELQKFLDTFYDAEAKINQALGDASYEFRLNEAWEQEMLLFDENATAFQDKLKETEAQANIFASAVGGAIGGLGDLLADSLSKNGSHFQKFGGIIIKTATEVLSQLAQTAIKQLAISQAVSTGQAVQAGTQTAAASGPAAAIVLPGIVAAMVAIVGSAFSGIAAFNFGGFVGDNNLVRMNGDERILTAGEANTFNNLMMNRDVGMSGQRMQVDVAVQGRLSGEDILISGTRTQTRKNRLG